MTRTEELLNDPEMKAFLERAKSKGVKIALQDAATNPEAADSTIKGAWKCAYCGAQADHPNLQKHKPKCPYY